MCSVRVASFAYAIIHESATMPSTSSRCDGDAWQHGQCGVAIMNGSLWIGKENCRL